MKNGYYLFAYVEINKYANYYQIDNACYFIKIYIAVVKEKARREKQLPKVVCPKM